MADGAIAINKSEVEVEVEATTTKDKKEYSWDSEPDFIYSDPRDLLGSLIY